MSLFLVFYAISGVVCARIPDDRVAIATIVLNRLQSRQLAPGQRLGRDGLPHALPH